MVDDTNGSLPRRASAVELPCRRESVANFYRDNRLEHLGNTIDGLGVRTTMDLAEITNDDLVTANLRPIEARRLRAAVDKISKKAPGGAGGGQRKEEEGDGEEEQEQEEQD